MQLYINIKKTMTAKCRTFKLDVQLQADTSRLVLFGPSGAGKTLTLNAIAGLLDPDLGTIAINGHVLFDAEKKINRAPKDRHGGYVFQNYALFPHLTVRENVGFGLKKRFWGPKFKDSEKVDRFLHIFGLQDIAEGFPGDISGGQAQRVALARAMICDPDLLLLDEPFSALDAYLRKKMRSEFRTIIDQFDIPVILITHDYDDLKAFADAVAVFDNGRIVRYIAEFDKNRQFVEKMIADIYSKTMNFDDESKRNFNTQRRLSGYRYAGESAS